MGKKKIEGESTAGGIGEKIGLQFVNESVCVFVSLRPLSH